MEQRKIRDERIRKANTMESVGTYLSRITDFIRHVVLRMPSKPLFLGFLENVEGDQVTGWLLCRVSYRGRLVGGQDVAIYCDGALAGIVRGAEQRNDVAKTFLAQRAESNCGFRFVIPTRFCKSNVTVVARAAKQGWQLSGAPQKLKNRSTWTLGKTPRAVVAAHDGLPEMDLARLHASSEGYTIIEPSGLMPTPVPMVYPKSRTYSIHCPPEYGEECRHFTSERRYPDLIISKLSEGICLPLGLLLTSDGNVIDDCFQGRFDQNFHHGMKKIDGTWVLNNEVAIVRRKDISVLWLDQQHINHYGHFAVDSFSKVWALHYLRDQGVKIVVTRSDAHWMMRILEIHGVRQDEIFLLDEATAFDAVYAPTRAKQVFDYVSPPFFESCLRVAQNVSWKAELFDSKWYVSRRLFSGRQLVNEARVENIFLKYGYKIVNPEEIPVDRQIAIFAYASAIAGCSGSSLYNVMYQTRLKSLIVLASPLLVIKSEQLLYARSGLPMTLIIGDEAVDHPDFCRHKVHSPWVVNEELVDACLERVWGRQAPAQGISAAQRSKDDTNSEFYRLRP